MLWTPQAERNCGTAAAQSPARSAAAGFRPEIVRFILPPTMEHSMRLVFRSNINATYFVGRTPASAAGPLAGHSDLVKTSTSRARAPGAGQGTRPTDARGRRGNEEGMSGDLGC